MAKSIFERAKSDSKRYTQQTPLTFFKTYGDTEYTVLGTAARTHLDVDPDTGTIVNSLKINCTVSEELLTELNYETRNANGNISLVNSYVKYNDGTGIERIYKITQVYPDDTLGLIVCMLGAVKKS